MKGQIQGNIRCSDEGLTDMKSKPDLDPTNNIVSGLLKAAMAGTDPKKQNGEVSAVNNSSSETK